MIQRIQSVWLFFAAVASFLFTQIPLYSGLSEVNEARKYTADENLLLFALGIVGAILALVTIFLFKNRKLQLKLTGVGIFLSVGLIALEVWMIDRFGEANPDLRVSYSWGSLLPIAMIVLFLMAAINIRKDIKLIKSLDRLR